MKWIIAVIAMVMTIQGIAQTQDFPPLSMEDPLLDDYLQNRKPAVLRIKVVGNGLPLNAIVVKYTVVHIGPEMQISTSSTLDSAGEMTITLQDNFPYQQVWLNIDNYVYTVVVVNEDLQLTINASGNGSPFCDDNLTFKGADAQLNEQLLKRICFEKSRSSKLVSRLADICFSASNNRLPIDSMQMLADSIFNEMKKVNAEFLIQSPGFVWAIETQTKAEYYQWLLVAYWNKTAPDSIEQQFVNFRPYLTTNETALFYRNLKNYYVAKNFAKLDVAKKLLFADTVNMSSDLKLLTDSIVFLETNKQKDIKSENLKYLYKRRSELLKNELEEIEFEQILATLNDNSNEPRRSILLVSSMERWKDQFESRYPVFAYAVATKWTKRYINYRLQEARKLQREIDALFAAASTLIEQESYIGKSVASLPFGADLYKLDSGVTAAGLIMNLRNRFPGKALIFDLWATWCMPCISDMPNSIKLQEENADLPIEYIYLCTTYGSDEKIWKSRIGSLKIPGTHIFINDAILDELRVKLNARSGFPSHIIIDKNGKIKANAFSHFEDLDREQLKDITGIR